MTKHLPLTGAALIALALLVVPLMPGGAAAAGRLTVSFAWSTRHECSSTPPAFRIGGIPKGTRYLRFTMTDLDVPTYHHGGGTIAYKGSGRIPEGAFRYTGPCPPSGRHSYEFLVEALDANRRVLAKGTAVRKFPPR
jgi:phosphatidylethanolamine-binding protein (PEBP) family uncharacterized protein